MISHGRKSYFEYFPGVNVCVASIATHSTDFNVWPYDGKLSGKLVYRSVPWTSNYPFDYPDLLLKDSYLDGA